jgi:hypothetical protein
MIDEAFKWFWTAMVFASVAWYAYLLFHVGIRGGWDIFRMTRALSRPADKPESGERQPGA